MVFFNWQTEENSINCKFVRYIKVFADRLQLDSIQRWHSVLSSEYTTSSHPDALQTTHKAWDFLLFPEPSIPRTSLCHILICLSHSFGRPTTIRTLIFDHKFCHFLSVAESSINGETHKPKARFRFLMRITRKKHFNDAGYHPHFSRFEFCCKNSKVSRTSHKV